MTTSQNPSGPIDSERSGASEPPFATPPPAGLDAAWASPYPPQSYGPLYPPPGPPVIPPQRQGPGGFPPYPSGPGPRQPRNGFGVTALVLGIIGLLFAFLPIVGVIAWPMVIPGLIFGLLGISRARAGQADNQGVAIAGTVLSALGLIVCIVWLVAFGSAMSSTSTGASSSSNGLSTGGGSSASPPAISTRTQAPRASFPGATVNDEVGNGGSQLTVGDIEITTSPLTAGDSTFGAKLCSTVSYRNIGSGQDSFNGLFDWKLQDPSGAALMPAFSGSDDTLSSGQLAPGGTTGGDVCFDRKGGAAGQYVLLYDPISFSSARGAWLNQIG